MTKCLQMALLLATARSRRHNLPESRIRISESRIRISESRMCPADIPGSGRIREF